MKSVWEPARETPVAYECDVCVIGGSCTGVFAAVRTARLGWSVALVEQNILWGGMATAAQVNEWHSLHDVAGERQIIGGLTAEVLERLEARQAVRKYQAEEGRRYRFNSAELALELDALVAEHEIRPFLKCSCVGARREGDRLSAAIVEDKSGRRAIVARFYIDASGDGDLLRRAGFAAWKSDVLQPVNYQILAAGLQAAGEGSELWERARKLAGEFDYPLENGAPWLCDYPSPADVTNIYGARLNGVDASDADQATRAILEGRRRQRALLDMMRRATGARVTPLSLAHALGVRETWHARCRRQLTGPELLAGRQFGDTIGRGIYPLDIHSPEGTTLRYLDGREQVVARDGQITWRRWREKTGDGARHYEIPYRCLVPESGDNLLVAGRLLDADRPAFGGVRVMVTMNQTGEAAGVAAGLALRRGIAGAEVPAEELRRTLTDGGSRLD